MLLTTELSNAVQAATICVGLYTYRSEWKNIKILKSGCQVESYRLAATRKRCWDFLVIAAELLRVTYLHRTQPDAPATTVLSPVQLHVLKARLSKLPKVFTVA